MMTLKKKNDRLVLTDCDMNPLCEFNLLAARYNRNSIWENKEYLRQNKVFGEWIYYFLVMYAMPIANGGRPLKNFYKKYAG